MKLFAFQPQGYGELSFFIMSEALQDAKEEVETWAEIEFGDNWKEATEMYGWNSYYYKITVVDKGVVVINNNE